MNIATPLRDPDSSIAALGGPEPALSVNLAVYPPPIVVFCKSHSGSRLLVKLLEAAGVFMGAHRNESGDSWDLLPLLRYLVSRHYPAYETAIAGRDPILMPMAETAFRRHLHGYPAMEGQPWGWKLCETTFALPLVRRLFPSARYIHLLRDGRDVAFSHHVGPTDAFWRKIYFGRADIESWRGMALTGPSYRRAPHLFNAQHWLSSAGLGHREAQGLGSQCLELRYEDICLHPAIALRRLFEFIGRSAEPASLPPIYTTSVGKFRRQPRRHRQAVLSLIAPLQEALGYPAKAD